MTGGTARSHGVISAVAAVVLMALCLGIALLFDSPTSTWLLLAVVFLALLAAGVLTRSRRR